MSDLLALASLQELDKQLDQARGHLASIEERLAGNAEILAVRGRLDQSEARLADLASNQRSLDRALQDLGVRIEREEKKLMDGSIRNHKELQALGADVDRLKEERGELENQLLEILGALEATGAEQRQIDKELKDLTAAWDQMSAGLKTEAATLRRQIEAGSAERDSQTAGISANSLRVYEGLRRRKAGIAVVRVSGGSCGGCRVTLPDALRRQIVASQVLVQCPNCERVLTLA